MDNFLMNRNYVDMLKAMSADDAKAFIIGLADYALDGIEPNLEGNAKFAFIVAKPTIDTSKSNYLRSVAIKQALMNDASAKAKYTYATNVFKADDGEEYDEFPL